MSITSIPDTSKFWSKVYKTGSCWLWTGAINGSGYGVFGIGQSTKRATHVAFRLTTGRWPTDQLNHLCPNRSCVNPEHVYEGTQKQNVHDAMRLARMKTGRTTTSKLTETQVLEIKARIPRETRRALAKEFGVSHGAINLIAWGKNWKDV